MQKKLTVTFTENQNDILGNGENVHTSIMFDNGTSFITMTFGGRDGMGRNSITIDELRGIFERLGVEE